MEEDKSWHAICCIQDIHMLRVLAPRSKPALIAKRIIQSS